MQLSAIYPHMLDAMEAAFRGLEGALPPPVKVDKGAGRWVYRPAVQDAYHAIVQKLVVVQSGLRAALILLERGHIMEQGVLSRVVDEANEDIAFLVYALTNDEITPLHKQYLESFWAEEFGDYADIVGSHQARPTVQRKKIRAYLSRIDGLDNPSRAVKVGKVMSNVYSGFVHGASTNIMETMSGDPPRFHTKGMLGTPRTIEYSDDLWNYMYRGLQSHILAAKAFGAAELSEPLIQLMNQFEDAAGKRHERV